MVAKKAKTEEVVEKVEEVEGNQEISFESVSDSEIVKPKKIKKWERGENITAARLNEMTAIINQLVDAVYGSEED